MMDELAPVGFDTNRINPEEAQTEPHPTIS